MKTTYDPTQAAGSYTLAEAAEEIGISYHQARRIFEVEPGVENWGTGTRAMLRIPPVVLERVRARRTRQAGGIDAVQATQEKHYAPWVRERQEQLEEDVRRTFLKKVVPMRKKAG